MTFSTYGLGSAHYFTCSNLSGDAFLKVSNDSIELLTDREHLEIAQTLIIGGSIFSKRLAVMNNEYLCSYDEMKAKTYGIMLDAKLLYGGIMENFPNTSERLRRQNQSRLDTILNTSNESPIGYILEVDLDYADSLHKLHKDFPSAPTKERIEKSHL